jgi:small GTP-binding protein
VANLNETPSANRVHIAVFGLRNAGKSTLVNALTGRSLSIVSATPGTTTDPVSATMELLPLGPCRLTDTAGLDDDGAVGAQRVERTRRVLETTDVAVWVASPGEAAEASERAVFEAACAARRIPVLVHGRGESPDALKARLAAVDLGPPAPGLLDGCLAPGERIVCVCPIDASAPKGRLILPQVQLLRAALDRHAVCLVCQPPELAACLDATRAARTLVVSDSQAFADVARRLEGRADVRLTSFSILFARQKGDVDVFLAGLRALASLKDGDRVLVAEGCTHHRQCEDIGAVKIPAALARLTGRRLEIVFSSGADFPVEDGPFALAVQCGGCMITRRDMMRRLARASAAGVPVVNYGLLLAAAAGLDVERMVGDLKVAES